MTTGPPDPPYDVRLLTCFSDFIELTWVTSSDNNSPVLEYVVYYTNTSEADELIEGPHLVVEEQGVAEGTTLSALVVARPWVRYQFYVVARNALGESDMASRDNDGTEAVCFTPETAPRSNPEDVCTRLTRPNQLIIVWKVGSCTLVLYHC